MYGSEIEALYKNLHDEQLPFPCDAPVSFLPEDLVSWLLATVSTIINPPILDADANLFDCGADR